MKSTQSFLLPAIMLLVTAVLFFSGCSSDDTVTPPPNTGEVLLAEVSGDSVGISSGSSTKSLSITGNTLNFTDRDSARLTFYYSGENNSSTEPMTISYDSGPSNIVIYNAVSLNILPTEQYADITIASPKVNQFFKYKINTLSPGFSYFKFRDLKIYKK
ncbi:MAG TPA: hypothetical protein PK536_10515 [Ignavibacteria bacterium]|nr:hypothetical protein [Bacteroidota bacterium]HRI85865.1 hypothetical protein [Ignavibacteria bacterium]HRK00401.1 hypothetical protein [Ignavibacteria bacterium]